MRNLILLFIISQFSIFANINAQTAEVLQEFGNVEFRMEADPSGGGTILNMLGTTNFDRKLWRLVYDKNELVPPNGPIEFAWEVGTGTGFVTDEDFFGIGRYDFNIDFIFKETGFVMDNTTLFTGIGELTPDARLHVYDLDDINDGISVPTNIVGEFHGGQFGYGYQTVDQPSEDLLSNIARFRDDGNTSVYINRNASAYQLQVDGDALASGGIWVNSDRKLKKDIQDFSNALSGIRKLMPTSYYFKTDEPENDHLPEEHQFGLIAQELQLVYPNLVREIDQLNEKDKVIGRIQSVNYLGLIPVLISSVQELDQSLTAKSDEVAALKTEITALKDRLDRLEKTVSELTKG